MRKGITENAKPKARRSCSHRWVLETPDGRRASIGVCKRCGSRRTFPNSLEGAMRSFNTPPPRPQKRTQGT